MSPICFNCSQKLDFKPSDRPARRDTCPSCDADLHTCLNCRHYDESAYNQCRESQAERVLDKDRSNFCDYFAWGSSQGGQRSNDRAEQLKKLDDLFK